MNTATHHLNQPAGNQTTASNHAPTGQHLFSWALLLAGAGLLAMLATGQAVAQAPSQLVRLAKLDIYPEQLERYKALLREEIETSLRLEPGVLTLYPVADKANPTHITLLEIYASREAYQAHLQTPHFLKYKTGTAQMVKTLELTETTPLLPAVKVK